MLGSVGGLVLVQRLVPHALRKQHNDVAGFIYAVLGVAYAVLLGLMVVAVWTSWEDAKNTANQEAGEVAEIFWLAHQLPEPEGQRLQELAMSYARVVVDEEWPLMKQGRESPRAWALLDEIRAGIQTQEPRTSAEQSLYQEQLSRVYALAEDRRERLLDASEGLPALLWVVLLVGGVTTVSFTYLFGLESTAVHTLMVAALALVISLVLLTVAALDHPFKGDVRIGPDAFQLVLERFQESKLNDL